MARHNTSHMIKLAGRYGTTQLQNGPARHDTNKEKMARYSTIKNGTARQGTLSKWARHEAQLAQKKVARHDTTGTFDTST